MIKYTNHLLTLMYLNFNPILSIIFFLIFQANGLQAQQTITVQGTIYSETTQKPLPYVTIALSNNLIGTVSNLKGKFKLLIPVKYQHDYLHFAHIGYRSLKLPIQKARKNTQFRLKSETHTLKEVVITGLTARTILKKALEKIPENYAQTPYVSQGFYRLTTQKDNSYISASEAFFEVYNAASNKNNQLKLHKMRAIKHDKFMQNMELHLNPQSIFEADIVRHIGSSGFLDKKGLKNHVFTLEGTYPYQNSTVYSITFDQKDGLKKARYQGKIWIDTQTFAFVYFDFQLSPKGIKYKKVGNLAERALMRLLSLKIGVVKEHQQYAYKKIGHKYYLFETKTHMQNTIKNSRSHFDFLSDSRLHYVVTHVQTNQVQAFSANEVLRNKQRIEKQSAFFDKGYWDAYNIVLPTIDFGTIAQSIAASNDANRVKTQVEDWLRKCPKDKTARIDSIISFYHKKGLFQGNALIEYQGKVLLHKSYNNQLTKNQPHSQFRIGSTSKTFTSMLILLLQQEGRLKVSDTIGKYLPDYVHPHLTIEQLLTHQSGVPNYTNNSEYLAKLLSKPYSIQALVRQFCSDSLVFTPGSQFQYSNSGYVLLAQIIEQVTKQPLAQVLQEKIFARLAMDQSSLMMPAKNRHLVTGYLYEKPAPGYPIQNTIGAGGVVSTAGDLLKWSRALDQERLLNKENNTQLFVPRAKYADWDAHYGYGWMIDDYMFKASKRHKIHYHPGTDFGFHTMFLKQPDEKITLVLLSNMGEFPRFEISDLILNELN